MDRRKLFGCICHFVYILSLFSGLVGCTEARTHGDEASVGAEMNKGVAMRVLWTVSGYQMGRNARMSEDEARKMLFKPLDIDASSITFEGETCRNVRFSQETVEAEKYFFDQVGLATKDMSLKHSRVTVVKTSCTIPGFSQYVRLPDRRLICIVDGVLFFFEPLLNR